MTVDTEAMQQELQLLREENAALLEAVSSSYSAAQSTTAAHAVQHFCMHCELR